MMRLAIITLVALFGFAFGAVPAITQSAARLPTPRYSMLVGSTDKYVVFWGGSYNITQFDVAGADLFDLASGQFISMQQDSKLFGYTNVLDTQTYSSFSIGSYVLFGGLAQPSSKVAVLDTDGPSYTMHSLDYKGVPAGVSTNRIVALSNGARLDFFDPITKSWSGINETISNVTFNHAVAADDILYFTGSSTADMVTIFNLTSMTHSQTYPPYYFPDRNLAPWIGDVFLIEGTFYYFTSMGVLIYNRNESANNAKQLPYPSPRPRSTTVQLAHLIVTVPLRTDFDEITLLILDTTTLEWSNYTVPIASGRVQMVATAFQNRYIVIAGGYDLINGTNLVTSDKVIILEFDLPRQSPSVNQPGSPATSASGAMPILAWTALVCSVFLALV